MWHALELQFSNCNCLAIPVFPYLSFQLVISWYCSRDDGRQLHGNFFWGKYKFGACILDRKRFVLTESSVDELRMASNGMESMQLAEDQIKVLEDNFSRVSKHPDEATLMLIAAECGLSEAETAVSILFFLLTLL